MNSIGIQPNSPEYGKEFNCVFDVDVTEYDLSCGMLPINAPDGTLPWDICPKREHTNFGRHDVGPPTASYGCIADASTKVPGPGTYKIVAWHFFVDGAKGEVLRSSIITIIPPQPTPIPRLPTSTPFPTPESVPKITQTQQKVEQKNPTPTKPKIKITPSYFTIGSQDSYVITPTVAPQFSLSRLPSFPIQFLQSITEKWKVIWGAFQADTHF